MAQQPPQQPILKVKGDKAISLVLAFMQRNGLPTATDAIKEGVAKTVIDLYQSGGMLGIYAGSPLANELNKGMQAPSAPAAAPALADAVTPQVQSAPAPAPVNPQPSAPVPVQAQQGAPVFDAGPLAPQQPNQAAGLTAHAPHQVPVHAPMVGETASDSDAPNSLTDKPVPTPTVRY